MKKITHSKRIIKVLLIFWLLLPIGTYIDAAMYESPATRHLVEYGVPDNVYYAFMYQNILELLIFSAGMLLCYLLYRRDIHKHFKGVK